MMRPLNFLLIFTVCLAIALFSIENVQLSTIRIIPGVELQAPLAIELLLSLGVGAVIAWMFGLWNRLQQQLAYRKVSKEVQDKDKRIEALRQELESYQAQLEEQPAQLLPEVPAEEVAESSQS
ncbi:lipopolysaccharide assembly protein LapA domain-containing protein [Lusitaniella coriacea]